MTLIPCKTFQQEKFLTTTRVVGRTAMVPSKSCAVLPGTGLFFQMQVDSSQIGLPSRVGLSTPFPPPASLSSWWFTAPSAQRSPLPARPRLCALAAPAPPAPHPPRDVNLPCFRSLPCGVHQPAEGDNPGNQMPLKLARFCLFVDRCLPPRPMHRQKVSEVLGNRRVFQKKTSHPVTPSKSLCGTLLSRPA